jgi:hypothetical protein
LGCDDTHLPTHPPATPPPALVSPARLCPVSLHLPGPSSCTSCSCDGLAARLDGTAHSSPARTRGRGARSAGLRRRPDGHGPGVTHAPSPPPPHPPAPIPASSMCTISSRYGRMWAGIPRPAPPRPVRCAKHPITPPHTPCQRLSTASVATRHFTIASWRPPLLPYPRYIAPRSRDY